MKTRNKGCIAWKIACVGILLLSWGALQAQVRQRDASDVVSSIFKSKKSKSNSSRDTSTRITKPTISGLPAIGYTLTTRFAVTLTGNIAFRLDSNANLSTITSSVAYSQNRQFTFPLESNIWSRNGKYDYIGDIHFMKYPQETFGLGSGSSIDNADKMDYNYIRFYEIVLRQVTANFFLGMGYIIDWHYNISDQNPLPNGQIPDYQLYGPQSSTVSSGITINALYDTRDNSINPYHGFYASGTYRVSPKVMGSDDNWHSCIIDVRKYFIFPYGSRNVLAIWQYDWLVLDGHPPYLDLPSTGWDSYSNTGRGYIQGRFRGKKMVYGETEYRFPISADGLLGAVAFVNIQSFAGLNSNQLQAAQPGWGGGLRIKLNKRSRTNVDIDYGFGEQGSHGLFVNIGEAF